MALMHQSHVFYLINKPVSPESHRVGAKQGNVLLRIIDLAGVN
jgi:hypothetical protein